MNTGKRIRDLQIDYDITSLQLAKSLGVTPQQLSRWRHSEDIKLSVLLNICNALGVTIVNLLDQKKAESEEIKRKTEEYLKKGGKIKKLSTFDTGLKEVHGHLYHKTRGIK
jgi:transcriptional regulator with XRE-family HTH domain